MGSTARAPGREHIPNYPRGFIVLRILQLVVTIIILGVIAYSIAVVPFVANTLMLFTAMATLIVTIWLVSAHSCAPRSYNYWATLVLDIFLFLFWIISFVLLAISTAYLFVSDGYYCGYYSCYDYELTDAELAYAAILAAAAGLGAVNALLFFISLVIHSVVVCRHRRAGLHSKRFHGAAPMMNAPYQMTAQSNGTTYAAVPQQGLPFNQQVTAYNPHQMYNPPPPAAVGGDFPPHSTASPPPPGGFYQPSHQSFYASPPPPPAASTSPVLSQPTGDSYPKAGSPHTVHEVPDQPYQPTPYHPPTYNNTQYQNQ